MLHAIITINNVPLNEATPHIASDIKLTLLLILLAAGIGQVFLRNLNTAIIPVFIWYHCNQ